MTRVDSYLTFNGNCREAMTFYKNCFGGELFFQTVDGSPLSEKMPEEMKNCILYASLTKDDLVIMATDMVGEKGLHIGNQISLSLRCSSKTEIEIYFAKLSDGGTIEQPLEDSFWGGIFGGVTDKFGNHWILSFNKNKYAN
ncbi:MAG: VOC family protein [Bacteroidetes bacterium]|nr:VOC family protein [Bacteroidota bacterium]